MSYKKGEDSIEEYIYIWLSMIKELDYFKVLQLLKAFNSLRDLFNVSNNKLLFRNILVQNNLRISTDCFNNFTNLNLKEDAKLIYNNLINQNIKFISIFSSNYPLELKGCINAPLLLFYIGNIDLLLSKKKKIYVYNKDLNMLIYNELCKDILKNDNVIFVNNKDGKNNISIMEQDILKENYVFNDGKNDNELNIIISNKFNSIDEVISSVSDYLLLLKSDFNNKINRLSCNFLDFGKEILVVPGNIYDKHCSFSNYLLKEGATVILNKNDINSMF